MPQGRSFLYNIHSLDFTIVKSEDRQETKQISSMCTRQVISNKGERERRNVQVVYGRFRCEGQERSPEKVTHGQRLEGSEVSHSDI